MPERAANVAATLRERLLWALHAGTVHPGDRFPTVRDIAARYGVDARTAMRACRALATEGLLDMRRRSGTYVSLPGAHGVPEGKSSNALLGVFALGMQHGIPPAHLPGRLADNFLRRRIRVACVGGSALEAASLAEMATADYGVDSFPLSGDELAAEGGAESLGTARAVITTIFFATAVRQALGGREIPVFIATLDAALQRDLFNAPSQVYILFATRRWADRTRSAFAGTQAGENLRPLVIGEDDLSAIPADADVYVSPAAAGLLPETWRIDERVHQMRYTLHHPDACRLVSAILAAHMQV